MKILWVSNAAFTRTGYGTGTRAVVSRMLKDGHEPVVLAYWGLQGARIEWEGIQHISPRIDTWGNDWVVDVHTQLLEADLTVIHRDNWVTDPSIGQKIPLAAWFPIDSTPVSLDIQERMKTTRWNGTMSQWAVEQARQAGFAVEYLPHGFDSRVFRLATAESRSAARQKVHGGAVPDDAFMILMVSANKGWPSRKGFVEAAEALAVFMNRHPDAYCYIHALPTSEEGGPDLDRLLKVYGVPLDRARTANALIHWWGLEPSELAEIYHSADVLLQPTHGEGFGIPVVEAQACGIPVVGSLNSSIPELISYGWLAECDRELTPTYTFWGKPRVDDLVAGLEEAYDDWQSVTYAERHERVERMRAYYDDDAVYDRHWRPWLAKIESEL